MSAFFTVDSATDAWLRATRFLCENGDCCGLQVEIAKPLDYEVEVVDALDCALNVLGRRQQKHYTTTKHVAYTIFPDGLWRKIASPDPERLFDLYNKRGGCFDRLKHHRKRSHHSDWGTYFQRLSSAGFSGRETGQLKQAIVALGRPKKPAGAIHLHTGLPSDGIRTVGGPCLQALTVHAERQNTGYSLSACALYRNHDFFQKALGNYIGLGQLLGFLAECARLDVGKLYVTSGHAYCDHKKLVRGILNAHS
jgi:thymidylate synthase